MRALLLLTLLTAAPTSAGETWPDLSTPPAATGGGSKDAALIIGVEDYYRLPDIPGAEQNAKDWYAYLTRTRGVSTGNIKLLISDRATREEILAAAEGVAGRAGRGGKVWVVFVGHGAPSRDGSDGVLVGADAIQSTDSLWARSVSQGELLEVFSGSEVVMVVDACYSGQVAGGESLVPGSQFAVPPEALRVAAAAVLTAGKSDDIAGPLPGAARPAFSYLVLGALRGWGDNNGDGQVTADEAVGYARDALFATAAGQPQTPQLHGEATGLMLGSGRERGPDLSAMVLSGGAPAVHSTSGELVSSGGGFVADLDVSAALAEKACAEAAERAASSQRSSRVSSEAQSLAREAQSAWSKLGPSAEACLGLDLADRGQCISKVKEYIGWAGSLEVALTEGFEKVSTDCGERSVAMSAQRKLVSVPELAAAKAVLVRLESASSTSGDPSGASAGKYGYEMVKVPGGRFTMGQGGTSNDEKPAHTVSVSGFWMGKTEVTQGLYQRVMGSNPSSFSSCGASCPVESVSWVDAVTFANKLSALEGLEACYSISGTSVSWPKGRSCTGYRLPTEAEWEYAARAGQNTTYAGSNELDEVAWNSDNSGSKTHPVAQKRANAWGLYDMSGNVWEWAWDWYDSSYYQSSTSTDPAGPNTGSNRVYRGGSWNFKPANARVANRNNDDPSNRNNNLGFRLSRSNP